jgi:GT2 family glycosyltransferase
VSTPLVSILIVSFNTRELTMECLRSLRYGGAVVDHEVIVVDNASCDGSAAAARTEFPGVRLIQLEQNVGFGRANNIAAAEAKGEFLLLLNPDTVVRAGAVEALVRGAREHPAAGIWGGRTFFADGSLNPASCWARPTPWSLLCIGTGLAKLFPRWRILNPEAYGGWKRDHTREVDIVSGCFLLITRDLWDRLGGFDSAFFMYGEDADLCLRAHRVGARPTIIPDAEIVHHGGASERVRADKMVRLLTAKARLIRRHWRLAKGFGIAMLRLWAISRIMAHGVLRARRGGAGYRDWKLIWARRREWLAVEHGAAA